MVNPIKYQTFMQMYIW